MSSTFFRKLPTPLEIKTMYPVPEAVEKQKQLNDEEIRKIFTGESDKFAVIGQIKEFHKLTNYVTMEELYVMHLESNDLEFDVCINAKDLLGLPEVGRRFKGNIWMQGTVEF